MAKKTSMGKHSPVMYAVKGFILLVLGLALWRGFLTLDITIAIVLIIAGIKFLLMPLLLNK